MKKIAVIGGLGFGLTAMQRGKIEDAGIEIIEIDKPDDIFDMETEPPYMEFKLQAPPILHYHGQKEFVCKGKHQYKKEGDEWICQCGRNINS